MVDVNLNIHYQWAACRYILFLFNSCLILTNIGWWHFIIQVARANLKDHSICLNSNSEREQESRPKCTGVCLTPNSEAFLFIPPSWPFVPSIDGLWKRPAFLAQSSPPWLWCDSPGSFVTVTFWGGWFCISRSQISHMQLVCGRLPIPRF